jgi:hypothetical protein
MDNYYENICFFIDTIRHSALYLCRMSQSVASYEKHFLLTINKIVNLNRLIKGHLH